MRLLRILRDRLRALFGRDIVSDEIREEIQFHLDERIREHERRGLSPAAARVAALSKFGNAAVTRDRGYDVRGGGLMESFIQDVKYAVRLLAKQRGFSLVALTTLALGIGATTAIFCIADAALIRPLPFDKPDQLVSLSVSDSRSGRAPSLDDMDQWRSLKSVFAQAGAARPSSQILLAGDEAESVPITLVAGDYLAMYGMTPVLGRAFTADDERLGANPVALIGYRYWKTSFNGDPQVLGRRLQFSNDAATIVGVLRDDESQIPARIYMPLQATPERRHARQYSVFARLRDSVTLAQAGLEANALFARLATTSKDYSGYGTKITPEYERVTRSARPTIEVLLGVVGFVLLIACVNVASLQLARGATRHTELAVRAAIGAGRARLIRQLLTESLVLAIAGSMLGALVAWLVLDVLVANVPVAMPSDVTVSLNLRVLGATIALSTLCGLLFGLAPAFRSSHADLASVLGHGSRGIRTVLSKATGGVLIAVEIAAAIMLVTGAALMARSFARLSSTPLGFDPNRFYTVEVRPVDDQPEVFAAYYDALLDRVRLLPGVASAGATNALPLGGSTSYDSVTTASNSKLQGVIAREITPGYLESLGVRLAAGRYPSGHDVGDRSWIVLSERAANELFPGSAAVGERVKYDDIWRDVIGVTGNLESRGPEVPMDAAEVFVNYAPLNTFNRSLAGRQSGQPLIIVVAPAGAVVTPVSANAGMSALLRDAAQSVGVRVVVRRIRRGGEWLSVNIVTPRQRLVLLGTLGSLGLLLALVGVFGVTSFAVSRRIPEIGVRLAFGARPGEVVRMMVRDAAMPIAAGIAIGLGGAFFLSKIIATFLYQTAPRDPAAFAAAALVLAACGAIAAWIPARRAAKVDPVVALRAD